MSPLARKALLAALPALVILGMIASTIWGDDGLLMQHKLRVELDRAHADLAAMQRENQQLQRDLLLLDGDPRAVERLAAEELAWGAPGAVIYRFESR